MKSCVSVRRKKRVIQENYWDHNVKIDAVKCPVDCVGRNEVVLVSNLMIAGKDPGPSHVSLELIAGSEEVEIHVMAEFFSESL